MAFLTDVVRFCLAHLAFNRAHTSLRHLLWFFLEPTEFSLQLSTCWDNEGTQYMSCPLKWDWWGLEWWFRVKSTDCSSRGISFIEVPLIQGSVLLQLFWYIYVYLHIHIHTHMNGQIPISLSVCVSVYLLDTYRCMLRRFQVRWHI